MEHPYPVDAMVYPRFSAISTFMRLPHITDPKALDIAIIGVPFDGSAGYLPGARLGPREIRNKSSAVRTWNPVLKVDPFEKWRIGDYGDVRVNPFSIEETYKSIESELSALVAKDVIPVSVGGDHGITYPILRAIGKKHGPVALIQVDAHEDTYDTQFGHKTTHATMLRRAVEENIIIPAKVFSIGLRGSLFYRTGHDFGKEQGFRIISAEEFSERGIKDVAAEVRERIGDTKLYFTLDIDGIDPAYAPGTAVPEIGGLSSLNALQIIRMLSGLHVVGTDLVEVSPLCDGCNNMTSILAAQLLFEMLCIF